MVRHQIVMQRAEMELTLTLVDQKLIIHGGDTRLEQEFPSAAALVEHALRVVKLRQHDGYRVIAERKDDQIVMPPDPKPAEADDKDKADKPEKAEKAERASAEPKVRRAAKAAPVVAVVAEKPAEDENDEDDEDDDEDDEDDDDAADKAGEAKV